MRSTLDRVVFAGAGLGLAVSLGFHVAVVTAGVSAPAPPWSWGLHAGTMLGFWVAAGRVTAAGLRGLDGVLRIRRMVPIPVRLVLGAATVNALVTAALSLGGPELPGRALTAYWTMMYLLVAVLFAFVVRPLAAGRRPTG